MHRIVFDTGVLVSALIRRDSIPGRALDKALQQSVICMSDDMLDELIAVIQRPKFRHYYDLKDMQEFLAELLRIVKAVPVTTVIRACADPNDDKVLSLAISGTANAIITNDHDLLAMNPFRDIAILTPRLFLDRPE